MAPSQRTRLALGAAALALASFGLGLLVAGRPSAPPPDLPPPSAPLLPPVPSFSLGDAGPDGPKILLDPDGVKLLPDSSLRLDLPEGFGDAGAHDAAPGSTGGDSKRRAGPR
ncbi:hypothetical protein [Chondromyces apiculatus]|uniref:Uncharacterized protein n=1 Tax=Chondromyces apiculatus DSM 436 TaxID=1192034 RepID=A0A017TA66_9BACT|nr:hypothetical protein [Chondromyces apiculatus]EYF05720.1 Hypothetical protein CAP_3010 [Chondromyces apiculatus DSM 436]